MIIYKATNIKNNKSYIGQTIYDLKSRIKSHISEANRDNLPFHNALLKYENDFKWEIIEQCESKNELDEMEFHYILQYNTLMPNGYNLTLGGEGTHGWIPNEETKKNISQGVKKWWVNVDQNYRKSHGYKLRDRMLGNVPWNKGLTQEDHPSIKKISKASCLHGKKNNHLPNRKGCVLTEEHKNKIRKTKYGERNGWHLSNITKEQLENKSKFLYKIISENGSIEIVKVLSVWCRKNNIEYEKMRHYINKNVYKFGYKINRIK